MGEIRYFSQFGSNPRIEASLHMSGPQNADQIPQEVRELLNKEGVKKVIVLGDYGTGERIVVYEKMND